MSHSHLKYATVCSGIEAPSSAWHSLGWQPVWFSEIEPFPCKVLKHHYPQVPNLGDMTKLNEHEIYRESTIDLFCGGTPCQSFSIAGLRGGLDDGRGNLALEYCRILIAKRPRWFLWENVPGVFSSNGGKDFACILSAFTGKEINAEGLGNAGVIEGEFYSVAWRVLDAQYFGVPQRRRRVFVVGYLGEDWRPPYAVLFERDSLRRDFEASAKERKGTTGKAEGDTNPASWWDGGNTASTLTKHNANGAQRMPDKDNFGALLQSCPYQKNVTMAALNFDMYSGECKEVSPCLQKDRAEDTLVYPLHDVKAYGLDEDRNGQEENSGTLRAHKSGGSEHIVAYDAFTLTIGANQTTGRPGDIAAINAIARRLTPLECERLQGFPDNHTAIPGAKDGHRYAAIGNSMAVPVMKWIGERIAMMDKIMRELKAPTP